MLSFLLVNLVLALAIAGDASLIILSAAGSVGPARIRRLTGLFSITHFSYPLLGFCLVSTVSLLFSQNQCLRLCSLIKVSIAILTILVIATQLLPDAISRLINRDQPDINNTNLSSNRLIKLANSNPNLFIPIVATISADAAYIGIMRASHSSAQLSLINLIPLVLMGILAVIIIQSTGIIASRLSSITKSNPAIAASKQTTPKATNHLGQPIKSLPCLLAILQMAVLTWFMFTSLSVIAGYLI